MKKELENDSSVHIFLIKRKYKIFENTNQTTQ